MQWIIQFNVISKTKRQKLEDLLLKLKDNKQQ